MTKEEDCEENASLEVAIETLLDVVARLLLLSQADADDCCHEYVRNHVHWNGVVEANEIEQNTTADAPVNASSSNPNLLKRFLKRKISQSQK